MPIKFNAKNYQAVIDQIKAHPKQWKQHLWHCGTSHCFGGWAQILSQRPADEFEVRADARQFLGITALEADYLFDHKRTLAELIAWGNAKYLFQDHTLAELVAWGKEHGGKEPDAPDSIFWSYDRAGYDCEGYDRQGYDRQGYDRNGRDGAGYDRLGYRNGYDRDGLDKNNNQKT
jgi:hypothetical protein